VMQDAAYEFAKERFAKYPRQSTAGELHRIAAERFPGKEHADAVFAGVHRAVMELPRSARDVLNDAIRLGPAPRMKLAGFRKTRMTWHRWCVWGCQVVQVQASAWSDRSQTSCTVNIGGYCRGDASFDGVVFDETRPPPEVNCSMRQRIGRWMPECLDHWWEVRWCDDPQSIAFILANAIEQYVFPVLDESRENVEVLRAKCFPG
jgi:hypothetical protein